MSTIPIKPRDSDVRRSLKQLKDGYDNPLFDDQELLVELNARRAMTVALKAYKGEIFHQIGLRKWRRGEINSAYALLQMSVEALAGNPLGQARALRDMGMLELCEIDTDLGLANLKRALALHGDDLKNQSSPKALRKGRRQQLITQSYLWRAQIIVGRVGSRIAKRELLKLVGGPDFDFCVRDRKVIIDFLVPRTRGPVRRELLATQAAILLERRKRLDFVRTCIVFVIDLELSIASSVIRRLLRKE